jgi:hypothetical protein
MGEHVGDRSDVCLVVVENSVGEAGQMQDDDDDQQASGDKSRRKRTEIASNRYKLRRIVGRDRAALVRR